MKIVMNETYDYLYNVWTYEKDHVYNVEDVPRSDFYHYWHGPNLDVIPHALAHPAAANEIKSLPDGDALHKHDKPVKLSMDSVLNPKHVDIPESERPAVIESMDDFDDIDDNETDVIENDTAEKKKTARATGRKRKNGSSTAQHARNDDSSSNDSTKTVKTARNTAKVSKTADSKAASQTKRKTVKKTSARKTVKKKED